MDPQSETWPPAPNSHGAGETPAGTVTVCPACSRKLLTRTSILCNWCGAKIDDPEYQQQAAKIRQENDQAERARLEAILKEETQYGGPLGRLRRVAKQKPPPGSGGAPPV